MNSHMIIITSPHLCHHLEFKKTEWQANSHSELKKEDFSTLTVH